MLHRCVSIVVAVSLWLTQAAAAQSINIDFGPEAGFPGPSYAGAGLPGVWNAIEAHSDFPPPRVFGPYPLVDLSGQPTTAAVSLLNAFGTLDYSQPPPPGPAGDDADLMFDGLTGFSPDISQSVEVEGLENGLYRVITHTWVWPSEMFGMVVFVTGSDVVLPVGGPWPGQLTVGVTTMVHIVQVTDSRIQIEIVGAGPGSFFNGNNVIQGLQLWKIDEPPPCPADIAPHPGGNQAADVDDLFAVIAAWGAAGGPADIDLDGEVGIDDLFIVIAAWGPCPTGNPATCGDPDLGDCYAAHGAGGCSEPACCQAVCLFDPYCCEVAWDDLCAGIANLAADCARGSHPNCGNPDAGSCFEVGSSPLQPGCNDPECCATVCAIDPFCCTFGWDAACVEEALLFCSEIPPACGHPNAGDCFEEHITPFCGDTGCCDAVCAIDAFCCDVEWDEICVAIAHANCKGGVCGEGAGDCFAQHATPGCADSACCQAVCSVAPYCCEVAWDDFCAEWANQLCGDGVASAATDKDSARGRAVTILFKHWGAATDKRVFADIFPPEGDGWIDLNDVLAVLTQGTSRALPTPPAPDS